jgi:hypothetical protein
MYTSFSGYALLPYAPPAPAAHRYQYQQLAQFT